MAKYIIVKHGFWSYDPYGMTFLLNTGMALKKTITLNRNKKGGGFYLVLNRGAKIN